MNTTLELRSRPASSQGQKGEGERAHRRRLGRDGGASLIWRCSSKRICTSERQGRRVGVARVQKERRCGTVDQPRLLPVDRHASTYAHSPFVALKLHCIPFIAFCRSPLCIKDVYIRNSITYTSLLEPMGRILLLQFSYMQNIATFYMCRLF
jgi:hypothetical protein